MNISLRTARTIARITHLAVALLLGTMVYAPASVTEPLRPILMYAAVPMATLSGLFLWKQMLFARWLGLQSSPRS